MGTDISLENRKILELLAREFPNRRAAFAEIINLQAILNLPKGTEHYLSDLHGEYEAFKHILNNCSGVIREKVSLLFGETMTPVEQAEFCTLIYYLKEKSAPFTTRLRFHRVVRFISANQIIIKCAKNNCRIYTYHKCISAKHRLHSIN